MSYAQMSDLPVASMANNSDVVLLRSGLTDYQCAVSLIRNINIQSLSPIPGGFATATDLFIISRIVSSIPSNFNIRFSQVSVPKGTRMWFYNSAAPIGWSIVPGTGGNLLAVNDGVTKYSGENSAGSTSGTWQQTNHSLIPAEIPPHTHYVNLGKDSSGNPAGNARRADNYDNISNCTTSNGAETFSGNPQLLGNGHNHGNTWRPLANVGIIANKDG